MDGGCAICGKHEYLIPLHGEKGGPKWAPPQVVTEATDAYFEDQDTTKQWLEDCTSDGGPYAFTPTAVEDPMPSRLRQSCMPPGRHGVTVAGLHLEVPTDLVAVAFRGPHLVRRQALTLIKGWSEDRRAMAIARLFERQ
jgi:hypothetical protein